MIITAIVIAIALGIRMLVSMRGCAWQTSVRLTHGLAVAAATAAVHALLLYAAMALGDIMRFDDSVFSNVNDLIFIGLTAIVAVRWLFQSRKKDVVLPAYDITRWGTALSFAVASGVNVFIIGLGLGFLGTGNALAATIMLFIITMLSAYFGIMFGRQKVAMNIRRWQFMAVVLLLGGAVSVLF